MRAIHPDISYPAKDLLFDLEAVGSVPNSINLFSIIIVLVSVYTSFVNFIFFLVH